MITYTITEGQLVRLNDGVPEDAIDLEFAFKFRDALIATTEGRQVSPEVMQAIAMTDSV
jgi:hypothetical protein